MKVLLRADEIPLGSTVTKKTGDIEYIIQDRIRVFNETGGRQEILAQDGARFLCGSRGDANAVSGDKKLMWKVDKETLFFWLQDERFERESK